MVDAPEPPAQNPVILLHGILGQRHLYWNLFRRRLLADGVRVHEITVPYGLLGDLRIAARFLRDKVEATLRGDEVRKVDLVCHSAGGLVARYYLKYLDGHKHVDHVVCMGTPHLGTFFSYIVGLPFTGLVDVARQTRPGSHFLEEINGRGAIPSGVHITNIWSPIDGVVLPAQNAVLAGADNIKASLTTHWGFLWRRDIYEVVLDALRSPGSQGGLREVGVADAVAPNGHHA